MGLFHFFSDSGEEVIEGGNMASEKNADRLSREAALAIEKYLDNQKLGIKNLKVTFDAREGKVTLAGEAPDTAAMEKVVLAAGNIKGISNVANALTTHAEATGEKVRYHDVKNGETLTSIARRYYGDGDEYMKVFAANQPMLRDPDTIHPGRKLRVPD